MLSPKTKKFLKVISFLLFLFLVLLGLVFYQNQKPQDLEVIFFDVEEGDSIFIKTPYHQKILIDGGMDNTVLNKLGKNLPFWDQKIDLMILTHPHADHVTGLIEVLKRYRVKQIFYTGIFYPELSYSQWQKLIKEKNIPFQIITAGQITELGKDLKLITLWPTQDYLKEDIKNINNTSIVSKLIYKNTSFLFTGDLEWEGEQELLDNFCTDLRNNSRKVTFTDSRSGRTQNSVQINAKCNLQADVLKVGHHGSISSSTEEFLKAVQPKIAVISVGKNNEIDHPSLRVLRRLERLGIKIFRTDQDGDVKIISDGGIIKIDVED